LSSVSTLREEGYLKDAQTLADRILTLTREAFGEKDQRTLRALHEFSATLFSQDRFREAEKMVRLGLALRTDDSTAVSVGKIQDLELLARIELASAAPVSARTHLTEALEMHESLKEPSVKLEGRIFHTLAQLERESGNYEGASELGTRALELYGDQDQLFALEARLSYDLGSIAIEAGWIGRARELLDRCVRLLENRVDRQDPRWAYALESMAVVLVLSGNLSSPLPLVEEAIRINQKWFSANHSRVVEARLLKGMLLELIGDRQGARTELKWAVKMIARLYGKLHPRLIHPLSSLSKIQSSFKQLEEAEKLWKKAFEIAKKHLDISHPMYVRLQIDQALMFMKKARYFKAESLLKSCLDTLEVLHGKDSQSIVKVLEPLAALFRAQDRGAEAVSLLNRILEIRMESQGIGHPDVTKALEQLTGLYYEMGKISRALEVVHKSLDSLVEKRGEDHPEVLARVGNLIFLAQMQGENQRALEGYRMALKIQRRHFGAAHAEVAITLFKIAGLLRKMGKDEEALGVEKEAHLIRIGGNPEDKDILFPGKSEE